MYPAEPKILPALSSLCLVRSCLPAPAPRPRRGSASHAAAALIVIRRPLALTSRLSAARTRHLTTLSLRAPSWHPPPFFAAPCPCDSHTRTFRFKDRHPLPQSPARQDIGHAPPADERSRRARYRLRTRVHDRHTVTPSRENTIMAGAPRHTSKLRPGLRLPCLRTASRSINFGGGDAGVSVGFASAADAPPRIAP